MVTGPHPSHKTRISDASSFDEICVYCGATDEVPGGWGQLAYPCPKAPPRVLMCRCGHLADRHTLGYEDDRCADCGCQSRDFYWTEATK